MDHTQVRREKRALRGQVRADLDALDPGWVASASRAALALLAPDIAHGTVLAYAPLRNEVQLDPVLVTLATEGRLVLPRVRAEVLVLHEVRQLDLLRRGPLGICEPAPELPEVPPAAIDVVLVPGLAFGRDGTRLGRGGGYFDRLLPTMRARRVGVCFARQLFDTVPSEPHDATVEAIVTEEGRWAVG